MHHNLTRLGARLRREHELLAAAKVVRVEAVRHIEAQHVALVQVFVDNAIELAHRCTDMKSSTQTCADGALLHNYRPLTLVCSNCARSTRRLQACRALRLIMQLCNQEARMQLRTGMRRGPHPPHEVLVARDARLQLLATAQRRHSVQVVRSVVAEERLPVALPHKVGLVQGEWLVHLDVIVACNLHHACAISKSACVLLKQALVVHLSCR